MTTEVALRNPERVGSLLSQVQALAVVDDVSKEAAVELGRTASGLMKEVAATFDPLEEQAREMGRRLREARAKYDKPLEQAKTLAKNKILALVDAQEKEARAAAFKREQEEKARAEAQRKADQKALADAAKLEKKGDSAGAAKVLEEAAEKKLPDLPPEPLPQGPTETAGMSTPKPWSAEVTNLKALAAAVGEGKVPLTCIEAKMPVLNAMAKAAKAADFGVPGVVGVQKTGVSFR